MSAVSTPPVTPTPARRDAESTRTAILKAARYLLARHAHGDITLKAVADRAGVSPPLILKYFGNKDTLFARVMSFETDADALLAAPLGDLGPHMVRHVLVSQSEQGADPLLRIVFAPLHGEQGDILRAELAVATLLGLGVMYGIARGSELRASTVDALVDRYGPTMQAYLTP
ncbi:TetR/AcrR family transcriptional regulator [Streptomyces sp. NPDC016172]|uniref:TetR/AcrR family transcriptional regulator n=1 Tax=Streptomyces sp. NPDC016172 TaxID=3364964 RepID=UPI0036F4D912